MIRCLAKLGSSAVLLTVMALLRPQVVQAELAKSTLMETNVAYLRVAQTDKNFPNEMMSALNALAATNPIAGIVLDLRFATGSDDVKPAEQFLEKESLPIAILINAQTSGTAANLAEGLRQAKAGLIFGTAANNLQPDITVFVNVKDEKMFQENPYTTLSIKGTNFAGNTNLLPFVDIDHTTEADLVRNKIKDGDQDGSSSATSTENQKPFIRDPVLARGVDFIKGVAVFRMSKN
jgi:hypothetical protein